MYDRYKDRGFVILGVSIDDPPEALRAYAKSHRMQYPVLQMQSDIEDAYGPIFGVPMSYFIARDGSICKRHLGPATREQVERELKALL
jgi:peroxiredoxin